MIEEQIIRNLILKGKPYPLIRPKGQLVWPGNRGGYGDSERLSEEEAEVFARLGLIREDGFIRDRIY